MRFITITYAQGSKLEVVFGGQHEQRATELLDVDEFIGVKSHRAKGKRITTYEVAKLTFIEPEILEPADEDDELDGELEDVDVEMTDDVELAEDGATDAIDVDELMGDGIKADPNVDYKSKGEADDAGFSAAQLNLF